MSNDTKKTWQKMVAEGETEMSLEEFRVVHPIEERKQRSDQIRAHVKALTDCDIADVNKSVTRQLLLNVNTLTRKQLLSSRFIRYDSLTPVGNLMPSQTYANRGSPSIRELLAIDMGDRLGEKEQAAAYAIQFIWALTAMCSGHKNMATELLIAASDEARRDD